ncbi:NUDIX domain-containing protein [Patescibacteria group bacterium]|jgi:putative (di)nucleoside polyphosphate hydrolase|nr:NUDIX domain-containing protein [Patescibacteria group bacterium]
MDTNYFRAGAGSVIYNEAGEVAWFRRVAHPAGVWQFQQGGIDAGEEPEDALWRELSEEVGLTQESIERIDVYPRWTLYEYPDMSARPGCLGQVHRWWFLKLAPGVVIDLTRATSHEFDEWRFTTFPEAIAETNELKRHVYEELFGYFRAVKGAL